MTGPHKRRPSPLPPTPVGCKVWFVFVGLLALAVLGIALWAVIKLVTHYT